MHLSNLKMPIQAATFAVQDDTMRDDAHAQQIAAAATTLRTARLSMQSSQMKYHLRSLSRSDITSLLDAF